MSHDDLASELAAAAARRDVTTFRPVLLDAAAPDTAAALVELIADHRVVVVDELGEQLEQLVRGRTLGEQLSGARSYWLPARSRSSTRTTISSPIVLRSMGCWATSGRPSSAD